MATCYASALTVASLATAGGAGRRFYDDDPIAREPESQDASRAERVDIGLLFDLTWDLFVTGRRQPSNTRARNVNTIDEVPDSSWFTNRVGARAITADVIARGPALGTPPAPERWVIIREKTAGVNPGFTARDANGETWFLSFDAPESPDGSTAEVVVASKLFWSLGYNQVEMFLTTLDPDRGHDRSACDQAAPFRRTDRVHAPRPRRDAGTGGAQPGWHLSGRGGPPAARESPRRLPLRGHAPRRPERHRRARAPPRAARAARVRRVDEPDRSQGHQHARYRRHRERPQRREALPAGRRLHVRDVEPAARLVVRLGVSVRAGCVARSAALVRLRIEALADGALPRESDRSATSRATTSIRRPGSRRRRTRPTWNCAPTTRSGRRGG